MHPSDCLPRQLGQTLRDYAALALVTEVHNHLVCDNPECGATVPVDWERAQLWETITGPERDAHLCERCAELQRQGESLDFWILRCVRCGVTSETQGDT